MSKRDTYLPARDTAPPPRSSIIDAANFLRLAAKRFLEDREPAAHVDFAVANWLAVRDLDSALREGQEGKVPESSSGSASPATGMEPGHQHEFWGVDGRGEVRAGTCDCGAVACKRCLGSSVAPTEMGCFGPTRFGRCTECENGIEPTPTPEKK